MVKFPRTPPRPLSARTDEITWFDRTLLRVHRTVGAHVLPWWQPRTFGPLMTMRYDPQPGRVPAQSSVGVHYNATDVVTAVAEVYQSDRMISLTAGGPRLTGWTPTRPLALLDLTGTWTVRNGAAAALGAAPRSVCRAWAAAIHTDLPDLDGIHVRSTMTGAANVVLWERARDAMPDFPDFSRDLVDLPDVIAAVADRIGYRLG